MLVRHSKALWLSAALAACGGFPTSPHQPSPRVQSSDGVVMRPLELVTLATEGDPLAPALFNFADALQASDWWKLAGADYGLGALAGTARAVGPPITADTLERDLSAYIENAIQAGAAPPKNGHRLYLLYLPDGVNVIAVSVVNSGCKLFSGYHRAFGLKGDGLAVVQRCSAGAPLEELTAAASHEILEAATDPTGSGYNAGPPPASAPWSESVWNSFALKGRAEVGDLCQGTRIIEGAFTYQRIFSNSAAAGGGDPCVPAIADTYYNASPIDQWYPVAAGATVHVPVQGWSTGPTDFWSLSTSARTIVTGFASQVAAPALRNDFLVDVQVTAPVGAPSGAYTVVDLYSGFNPPPGSDLYHYSLVGAYVP